MTNIENFLNIDVSKLIYMFNRTCKYPSSIDNNTWYFFNSSHTCEIIINKKQYILPIIHTIIYNVNSTNPDIFIAILQNHNINQTNENTAKFTEKDGVITFNNYEFNENDFRNYQWDIIAELINNKSILSLYKTGANTYDFTFYVLYNNVPHILKITNNSFIFIELPVIKTSINHIAEQNIHTFSRQLQNNETEYVFYYAKPHSPQECFKYKKSIESQYMQAKSNNESINYSIEFTISNMEYLMLVYRIKYNCLSKLYVEFTDCANEII